jgi:ABC-type sugar transport system permease subunit
MARALATAQPRQPAARKRDLWHEIYKNRWAYVFISPFYLLFLIFGLFPIAYSFFLSFQRWNGMRPMEFVGLDNYLFLFGAGGRAFWQSIQNGVILFIMYVPVMTFAAIVLAVILNSKRVRFFQVYRTLIFAPYVTSMIAAGFVFRILLENNGGLFNEILTSIGLAPVPWLESVWGARVSLSLLVIWGWLGYNMVLMLAGLQTIPPELTEAAMIDGASPRQAFFYITIPLLRPMILFSVVLSTIGSFGLFNEVVALTSGTGGPQRSLLTPLVHIFNVAFRDFQFGRASAQAYVYFALIFVLTIVQFRYIGRGEEQS